MSTSTPTPGKLPAFDVALYLVDQFGTWWNRARWSARVLAAGVLTVASGVVLLVTVALLDLLRWAGGGLVQLVGHDGAHALAAWKVTHVVTDPLRHYLATAGAGLPASPQTLTIGWAVAAALLLFGALLGIRGARIGWAVIGAATTAMVYAGAPATGHLVAAAVTGAAWALLSIPAYWRTRDVCKQVVVIDSRDPRPVDDDLLV